MRPPIGGIVIWGYIQWGVRGRVFGKTVGTPLWPYTDRLLQLQYKIHFTKLSNYLSWNSNMNWSEMWAFKISVKSNKSFCSGENRMSNRREWQWGIHFGRDWLLNLQLWYFFRCLPELFCVSCRVKEPCNGANPIRCYGFRGTRGLVRRRPCAGVDWVFWQVPLVPIGRLVRRGAQRGCGDHLVLVHRIRAKVQMPSAWGTYTCLYYTQKVKLCLKLNIPLIYFIVKMWKMTFSLVRNAEWCNG